MHKKRLMVALLGVSVLFATHSHTASAAAVENNGTGVVSLKDDNKQEEDALPQCHFPDGKTVRYSSKKTTKNSVHIEGSASFYGDGGPNGNSFVVSAGESTTVKAELTGKLSGELNAQVAKIAGEIGASKALSTTLTLKSAYTAKVSKNKRGRVNLGANGIGFQLKREKMPTRSSSCVPEVVTSNGKLLEYPFSMSYGYKEF